MNERIRNNYFALFRVFAVIVTGIYICFSCSMPTGVLIRVLLLLAFFTGSAAVKEYTKLRGKIICLCISAVLFLLLTLTVNKAFLLLGIYLSYEIISLIRPKAYMYLMPALLAFIDSGIDTGTQLLICLLFGFIYVQHDLVVGSYVRESKENAGSEQSLRHDIRRKETQMREEIRQNLLTMENKLLEERAQLSQTLHDKLGHNINGSVYQLEAVKVIMEKDPQKAKAIVQAVIDALRTGMDEIRAILRKKRPKKHLLAMSQLEMLCEDCRQKGIDAVLHVDGDPALVPKEYLEVILDNCFETVSNSLKYSGCTRLSIEISILNKVIRCSVSDNGKGCAEVHDGMGISGMRKRIRQVNGILDISSDMGFTVNMLLPINKEQE